MILLVNDLLKKWEIIGIMNLKTIMKNRVNLNYFFLFIFLILVIGIAGNKCDKYEEEEVKEEDARNFADEIKAVFRLTSACYDTGINELFYSLGNLYLQNIYQGIIENNQNETENIQDNVFMLDDYRVNNNNIRRKKIQGQCC